jgi:hypothetical protein
LDKAEVKAVQDTLEALQKKLLKRIPRAAEKSPDLVLDDIEALRNVLELKMDLVSL